MMRTCEECKFWDTAVKMAGDDQDLTGLCRRHAPVPITSRNGAGEWPFTEDSDWCGEYQPKETEDGHN